MSRPASSSAAVLLPELERELGLWSDSGLTPTFWWRDDDAISDTPALRKLIETAQLAGLTVAIGVVAERAEDSVLPLTASAGCPLWQHGWGHHFHDDGEFGDSRPLDAMIEDALRGQETLDSRFGPDRWQRVFVPPNHRLSMSFKALIPTLGYVGVSAGDPLTPGLEGVREVNAEVDVMNWPARKVLPSETIQRMITAVLEQRRSGLIPSDRPTGILTHHLAFDDDAWRGVFAIVKALRTHPVVRFVPAAEVFPSAALPGRPRSGDEMPPVTVIVTSCARQDLLERTLASFFAFNTYPECDIIVMEDGLQGANRNLIERYTGRNVTWLATGGRVGQIRAIDRAYAHVRTDYIFHCEDDWEFYAPGFIEKSLAVLRSNPFILQVWLRAIDDTNKHPVLAPVCFADSVPYRLLSPDYHSPGWGLWHGFSWNPGLRRRSEYELAGSFDRFSTSGKESYDVEREVSTLYRRKGFVAAILADNDGRGYVRHLGWGRRVTTPTPEAE